MKTRERLLFMALGGLLVLAGMIVGQFVFSPVQAQDGVPEVAFKKVFCETLIVGDSSNREAVMIGPLKGFCAVQTFNDSGKMLTTLSATKKQT